MGMRIRTNVPSLTAQRFLTQNTGNLTQSFERLSSGFRINKSADDAAGLAISENMRAKVRGLNQNKRNANDAVSMVQIAEGGMNEMSNILIRARELTIQAASDTIGDTERGFLNREYTQLVDEIDRIAATTEFNGLKMFSGERPEQFIIQVGPNGTAPELNMDTITIDLSGLNFTTADMELGKGPEIGPKDGSDAPSREEIAAKLSPIDNALSRIASERATLGSIQSRLGSAVNNLGVSVENLELAKSRIRDVDFAAETAELTQARILTNSNVAILTQANATPEMALALLRS